MHFFFWNGQEIAKEAFTRSGANISLDDVARQTDVGPGTLDRHFPARDALLEAVYRSEVANVASRFAPDCLEALASMLLPDRL